jgi:hypothetical protein
LRPNPVGSTLTALTGVAGRHPTPVPMPAEPVRARIGDGEDLP